MNKESLKLFVWEGDGVLQDYTSGMIVALAHNLEEALKEIEKECNYCMTSFQVNQYKIYELKEPKAWLVWGGS